MRIALNMGTNPVRIQSEFTIAPQLMAEQASRGLRDCARCQKQAPLQEMTRKKRMLIYNPEPRIFCT